MLGLSESTWAQWMMMVQLQALFKTNNCLLTVTGNRTDPSDVYGSYD